MKIIKIEKLFEDAGGIFGIGYIGKNPVILVVQMDPRDPFEPTEYVNYIEVDENAFVHGYSITNERWTLTNANADFISANPFPIPSDPVGLLAVETPELEQIIENRKMFLYDWITND
jgi:hypothetical protein